MNAAIYLRVSTTEQALEGFGLDVQREKCKAMATVKGWQVIREYTDEGISGTKDEEQRPGLAAMLDAIQAGEIDVVIVASIDRLGRSTKLVIRFVEAFGEDGVDFVSCKESFDTTTGAGRFVMRMFASLAELDRDNIVEKTTDGRNARGRIDGERGGRVPMGYERVSDGLAIIELEAEIVREILSKRAAGATLKSIADSLNERGITTRRDKDWYASSVRVILQNEDKYKGGLRGESLVRWPVILEGE